MSRSWHHLPRVVPYVKPQWRLAVSSLVLMGFGVLVSVAQPWPMALLVDNVLGSRGPAHFVREHFGTNRHSLLLVAVIGGFVLALVGNGINVLNEYVNTKLDHS